MKKILSILLVIMLIITFVQIRNMYALYKDELSGEYETSLGKWNVKVNGTDIEYVIVQSKNNDYYLTHNIEKKYNKAGWVFADYRNKLDGTDKNIVIYGHNMKDNSMFATLENILKEEWYKKEENYIVEFITAKGSQKYQVFSTYKIKNEDYYIKTEFQDNEFEEFINKIKNRSIKNFNIDITKEDNILTLSTCADNNKYRIVLHAKNIDV